MNSKRKAEPKAPPAEETKAASSASQPAAKGRGKKVTKKKSSASSKAAGTRAQTAAASPQSGGPASAASQSNPPAGNGLVRVSLIASLLALAISAYAAYQFTLSSQLNNTRITGVEDRVNFIVAEQQGVNTAFDKLSVSTTEQVSQMHEQLNAVQASLTQLQATANTSIDDIRANLGEQVARWKLDEIHSLLVRVNRLYQLGGDQNQAVAGLRLAQASLATIDDPRLEAVDAALAEDIISVQSERNVDTRSLYNRLASVASLIPELVLAEDVEQDAPVEDADLPAVSEGSGAGSQDTGILAASKTLFSDIGSLVKHKDLDAPLQPSLDQTARFVVYESLQLNIEAAMAALLRTDDTAYHSQLALAREALDRYFAIELPNTKTVIDQLEVLQSYDISLKTQVISNALDALNAVMAAGN